MNVSLMFIFSGNFQFETGLFQICDLFFIIRHDPLHPKAFKRVVETDSIIMRGIND